MPPELRAKLPDAELFHEINEHRWLLSEARGRDVGRAAAVALLRRHRAARPARHPGGPLVRSADRGVRADLRLTAVIGRAMSRHYTGEVAVGGADGRAPAARPDHRQARRRADVQQRLPAALHADRRGPAHRRGRTRRTGCASWSGSTGRRCRPILTTHRHADHWQALAEIVDDAGAAVYAGDDDADELPVAVDERLQHGDTITVGDVDARDHRACAGTRPARSPCSTAIPRASPHLFTGDSLFPGGVGKTWSPEDFTSLIDDVEPRLFDVLPDETWFYPGHGDDSTLGAERPHLAEWRERGW